MRTIDFISDADGVALAYRPSFQRKIIWAKLGVGWDGDRLVRYSLDDLPPEFEEFRGASHEGLRLTVKYVFDFDQNDLLEDSNPDELLFSFASCVKLENCVYYKIPGRILGIAQDVYLGTDRAVSHRWIDYFSAGFERRTSIFRKISNVVDESESKIVIGGDLESSLPWEEFDALISRFPTTVTLRAYGEMVIAEAVADKLLPKYDYSLSYQEKKKRAGSRMGHADTAALSLGSDSIKLNLFRSLQEGISKVEELLEREEAADEDSWQKNVLEVLPILFPQYIAVLREAIVPEMVSKRGAVTKRKLDYLLIDASGNVDVIEMKKAFGKKKLLCKTPYRDNFIPARELSGGISQIEKYIYYLNHLGAKGEQKFSETCKAKLRQQGIELPDELSLRCLNPRGILMIGHASFSVEEQRDFDLIRRQYAHVVDVITYDDLLARLKNMAMCFDGRGTADKAL